MIATSLFELHAHATKYQSVLLRTNLCGNFVSGSPLKVKPVIVTSFVKREVKIERKAYKSDKIHNSYPHRFLL